MNDAAMVAGRRILTAVEYILAGPEKIRMLVAALSQRHGDTEGDRLEIAQAIVEHHAKKASHSGAITALPALIPGLGTSAALTAGGTADLVYLLKVQTEMALAIGHLYGHDPSSEDERLRAMLLVSLNLENLEAPSEGGMPTLQVFWNMAQVELRKLVWVAFSRLTVGWATRGLIKSLPLVGIPVGYLANRANTRKVGQRCLVAIAKRPPAESGARSA